MWFVLHTVVTHIRYVDDDDYNQGLKDQDRWNDPAAGFLTVSAIKNQMSEWMNRREQDISYCGYTVLLIFI